MTRKWRYDDAERIKLQDPVAILKGIGLKPGMTLVDVGCAEGFFAILAAKLVGEKGRVLAIDINEDFVKQLIKNAKREGLTNIVARVGRAEESVLCDSCADFVFFGIDLHDMEDPVRALVNARKMLKPSGRLIDLDWKKEPMEVGPPLEVRFSAGEASTLILHAGFLIEKIVESGPYHYRIVAKLKK